MASNEILSLARNQSRDQPALLFFELVGNDVCYPDPTLDAMTTPQEFYVNIMGMIFLPPKKIRQIQIFFLPKKNFNEKFFNVNLFEIFFFFLTNSSFSQLPQQHSSQRFPRHLCWSSRRPCLI